MRFLQLPQELIQHIITYVPDDDLRALEGVSRQLHHLSNDPLLWRDRCGRFKYWEDGWQSIVATADSHSEAHHSWKIIFYRRISIDKQATQLLNRIVTSPSRRIEYTEQIASYGYDAKDCLLDQLTTPETADDWLARRFHASSTLAYIHRQRAIKSWSKLMTSQPVHLEQAMCCFDLFVASNFRTDIEHVSNMLSTMSADILATHQDFFELTKRDQAIVIARYMRSFGFLGCQQETYHDLANCFLGVSMRTTRTTLPMVACSVFCSLAQRLGLEAYPCAYPYHVYVFVYETKASHFYLNPHENADPIFQDELEARLQEMGIAITPASIDKFLRPAPTVELVLRNARNILRNAPHARRHQPTDEGPESEINVDAAEYAALFAIALLSSAWTTRILEPLCRCLQESFPTDVGFIETYILPLVDPESRPARLLRTICVALRNEDGMARKIKRRSSLENRGVLFCIGTVFQHRRYGYQAAITGWTINMTHETVDLEEAELQKGLKQPFYRVMVEDLSVRYVAQENILEQRPTSAGRLAHLFAGKYFKRFSSEEGRFVSNMRDEYPED